MIIKHVHTASTMKWIQETLNNPHESPRHLPDITADYRYWAKQLFDKEPHADSLGV